MKKALTIILLGIISLKANSQGCVAIKSTGGFCTAMQADHSETVDKWMLNVNNRYFKSFRHFVGTEEQKQRLENNTEVINYAYTLDLFLVRELKNGWSIGVDVPIISNTRSSLYEHGGKNRYNTNSFGLGDVRFTVYKWLVSPEKRSKGNVQIGAGLKLPTGDYKYQDYFYTSDTTTILGPVDQSIQLGDGGTGFTTEINAFYNFSKKLGVYGNFYYLFNPREQNGVSTGRGKPASASSISNGSDVMSVPDQYMVRAGVTATLKRLALSAGIRKECLPAKDVIGGSNGFRRPGYIVSLEPGVSYQVKKVNLYAYVPVALKRNRLQSVPDMIRTEKTGVYTQGDAAFADYAVNIGLSFKF